MAIDLEPVLADIAAAIVAVWPETAANGIEVTGHASTIPFSDRTLPFATIEIGPFAPTDQWGVTGNKELGRLGLWYTDDVGGDASRLHPKLTAMQRYLKDNRMYAAGAGQVVDIPPGFSFADNLDPNQFWALTEHTQRAGVVSTQLLVYDVS